MHPKPHSKQLEKEINNAIETGEDPYKLKENYVARHLNINWWYTHMNSVIYEETYRIMGDKIVDFGCNHGLNTIILSRMASYANVTGIDRSKDAIKFAMENVLLHNVKNVNFILHSLNNIESIEDDYFTGGYMTDVIEHIYPKDREDILREIRRVMKNGSHLMIATPYDKHQWDDIHHVDFFDEIKIRDILLKSGLFDIQYIQHDMRYNLRNKRQNRLNILLKIVKD